MKYLSLLILSIFLATSCNTKQDSKAKTTTKKEEKSSQKNNKKENAKTTAKSEKKVNNEKKPYKPKPGIINDDTLLATFKDQKILFKDLKKEHSEEIKQAEIEALKNEYRKNKVEIEKYVLDKLLTEEAKKQGLKTSKQLFDKLTANVPAPSKKEIDDMKKKYGKEFSQRKLSDKEIEKLIVDYITNQKKNDIVFKYVENLKKSNNYKITVPYPNIPGVKIDIKDTDAFKGVKDAKIVLVEFSDFQCPYCAKIAPVISELTKDNKDIKVIFKHFPLSFHQMAKKTAKVSYCLNKQGKFWQFHDKVFANQKDLNDKNLENWVKELKINQDEYKKCLNDPNTEKAITDSISEGMKIGVKGTPSLYLNGVQINAMSKESINNAIESERNKVIGELTPQTVVATIKGKKITWQDFLNNNKNYKAISKSEKDKKLYETYARILSKELSKKILEAAAKEEGKKDINDYIKSITDLIPTPKDEDLKKLYESLKPQLKGKTFDEIKPQLIQYDKQMKAQKAVQGKLKELSEKYNVEIKMPIPVSPKLTINTEGSPFMGNKNAKHVLVVFSDFECPYCARAAKFIEDLTNNHADTVKVVFKEFPLPFHKQAKGAAIASLCFDKQGKFKEFHDKAFANQLKLKEETYINWAKEMKLNVDDFKKCLKDKNIEAKIDKDIQEGQSLGVMGTPTMFLDGVQYNDKHDFKTLSGYFK